MKTGTINTIRHCIIILMLFGVPAANAEADERQAVIEAMQSWERAVETGDYAELEQHYMENAVYYPHQAEPLVGRDAIMDSNRQRGGDATVEIVQEVDDVEIHNDWAIYSCLARVTVTPPGDAARAVKRVRVLLVMQKDTDGRWKILRDIDNTPPSR